MQAYDLVVAGAGPAGLTLAWKAAESGLRVFLFDKKKHAGDVAYTTSASFIDLKRWKLPDDVAHAVTGVHFASAGAFLERTSTACVLRRRLLLADLEKKSTEKGALVQYGTYARGINVRNGSIASVRLSDDTVVEAEVYADCSGLGNVFNRALPVQTKPVIRALGYEYIVPLKSEPQTVDLHLGGILNGGYGWLFPISNEEAIVGVGMLRSEEFRRIRELLDAFLKLPRIAQRAEAKPLESHAGVFSTGRPLKRFHRGNLVLAGDIALQGNPAAGEGIRFVMDAAEMASRAVVRAVAAHDTALLADYSRAWTEKYFRMFSTNYKLQRALYWLTGKNDLLDRLVRIADQASDETMLRFIRGEASPRFVLRRLPRVLARLFL
jgi:digeranylgeranylglycerophospholipid reductase